MHLLEGVVDLDNNAGQRLIVVITVKETDRVEDIVKVAGRGDKDDLAELLLKAGTCQYGPDLILDRLCAGMQIVFVVNRNRSEPVVAEQPNLPGELIQFIQRKSVKIDRVSKAVFDGDQPGVHHLAGVDHRRHSGVPKASPTAAPARTASSWKP